MKDPSESFSSWKLEHLQSQVSYKSKHSFFITQFPRHMVSKLKQNREVLLLISGLHGKLWRVQWKAIVMEVHLTQAPSQGPKVKI